MIGEDSDGDSTDGVGHPGDGDEESGFRPPDARFHRPVDDKVEGNVVAEADEEYGATVENEDRVRVKSKKV